MYMLNKKVKLFKLHVIEICVKQIRVNQGVGVRPHNFTTRQSKFLQYKQLICKFILKPLILI